MDFNYPDHFSLPPNTSPHHWYNKSLKTLCGSLPLSVPRSSEPLREAQCGSGRDTPLQRPRLAFKIYLSLNNFTFISVNDWGSEAFLWVTFSFSKRVSAFHLYRKLWAYCLIPHQNSPLGFPPSNKWNKCIPAGGRAVKEEESDPDIRTIQVGLPPQRKSAADGEYFQWGTT